MRINLVNYYNESIIKLPNSVKKPLIHIYIKFNRLLKQNYFEYRWDNHSFSFGYWDKTTLEHSHGVIKDGKIAHEGIEIREFDLSDSVDSIIDIGAHFGEYSIILSKMNSQKKTYSFEPNKYNINILKKNARLNNLGQKIEPHEKIVSGKEGIQEFYMNYRKGAVNHTLKTPKNDQNYRKVEVESVKISNFCKEKGIKTPFIKIDSEGTEIDIIKDILSSDNLKKPIGFIELHIEHQGITREKLENIIDKHDYKLKELKETYQETNPGFLFAPKNRKI